MARSVVAHNQSTFYVSHGMGGGGGGGGGKAVCINTASCLHFIMVEFHSKFVWINCWDGGDEVTKRWWPCPNFQGHNISFHVKLHQKVY